MEMNRDASVKSRDVKCVSSEFKLCMPESDIKCGVGTKSLEVDKENSK